MPRTPNSLPDLYSRNDPVGECLDTVQRRWRQVVAAMSAIAVGPSVEMLFGSGRIESSSTSTLLHFGQYSAPAAVVATGVIVATEVRSRRRLQQSREQARAIEEALGEPVDVVTARSASGEPTGCMRWYGLDGLKELPLSATTRLRRLAAWGAEHGVSQVAIASSWMDDEQRARAKGDEYRYYDAKTALTELKGSTHDKLIDNAVTGEVLVASPDALLALFDQDVDRVSALLAALDDKHLLELYEQAHGGNVAALAKLKRSIALRLAGTLDEGTQREVSVAPDGTRLFAKTSTMLDIDGTSIKRLVQGASPQTGQASIRVGESTNLFSQLGVQNLPALLAKLDATDDYEGLRRADVLAAVHLLLNDIHKELQNDDTELTAAPTGTVEPLYARLVNARKDVLLTDSPTSFRRRLGAMVIAFLVPVGMAAGTYCYANSVQDKDRAYVKGYNEHADYFDGKSTSRQYEKYLKFLEVTHGSEAADMRRLLETYDNLADLDKTYAEYLLATFRKLFPQEPPTDSWKQRLKGYQEGSPIAFGDVELTEHTMYTVTSLNGKSTAGYWTTGVSDRLYLSSATGEPIMPTKEGPYVLFHTVEGGDARADFMVELPSEILGGLKHGQAAKALNIPAKQGTVPIRAEVADATNPQLVTALPIRVSLAEVYSVDLSPKDIVVNGIQMEQPVLRYWLKEDNLAVDARAIGPMATVKRHARQVETSSGKPIVFEYTSDFEASDLRTIATKARRALSLSETATSEELYQAIKSKQYSYTPFKDAGVEPFKDIRYMDDEEALAALGEALANLESLNCNVATLLAVLAQADRPKSYINAAIGYNNNGDNKLTNKERHAWTINRTGAILDPTPAGSGTASPEVAVNTPPAGVAGLVAAATVLATVGYRRRKQLSKWSDKVRTHAATASTHAQAATEMFATIRWSDPSVPVTLASIRGTPAVNAKRPWEQYIANIGPNGVRVAEVQEYAAKTEQKLPLRLAFGAWLLQVNNNAIHRHAAHPRK